MSWLAVNKHRKAQTEMGRLMRIQAIERAVTKYASCICYLRNSGKQSCVQASDLDMLYLIAAKQRLFCFIEAETSGKHCQEHLLPAESVSSISCSFFPLLQVGKPFARDVS